MPIPEQFPLPAWSLDEWKSHLASPDALQKVDDEIETKMGLENEALPEDDAMSPWYEGVPEEEKDAAGAEEEAADARLIAEIENNVPAVCLSSALY